MLRFASEFKQEYLDGHGALQDQVYVRALAIDFFISLLNTVDGWAQRTVAEVGRWDGLSLDERNRRGMEILAQLPVDLPAEPFTKTPVVPETQRRSAGHPRH